MRLLRYTCIFIAALLFSIPTSSPAADRDDRAEPALPDLSLGSGLQFENGDYGTGDSVDLWKIPLLVEWAPSDRLSLSLEIPYLIQSSTGKTVLVGGTTTPTRRGNGRMNGADSTTETDTTKFSSGGSESGLGDINLTASYTLFEEQDSTPRLLTHLYAKFPTADEDKGLGTGEFDWGVGLGIGKQFGNWSSYAEALYIEPGSSNLYRPDAYWEWLASLSFRVGDLRPGISLSGGTAPFDDTDDPLEVKLRLSGLAGDSSSFSLYLLRGLSDASPDWGAGCIIYFDL